jgi:hypothetical protein
VETWQAIAPSAFKLFSELAEKETVLYPLGIEIFFQSGL